MKTIISIIFLFSFNVQALSLFPVKPASSEISCQWYVPVTSTTEDECVSSCNYDCTVIYGHNYTGYHGCVAQEFGYDCYCGVCY